MADPLTALVDREAPAPTNFFDPAAGQSILSRYSNARMAREPAEDLARSTSRLTQGRLQAREVAADELRQKREQLLQSREDADYEAEYAAKKEADASRKDFYVALNSIDHTADDYDKQVTEVLSSFPPSLVEDPGTRAILTVKSAAADDWRGQQRMEREKQLIRENQAAGLAERAKYSKAYQYITPDDLEKAPKDANGEPDQVWLLAEANRRMGEADFKDFTRKQELLQKGRLVLADKRNLSKGGQARRAAVEKSIVTNTDAFPSKVSLLLARTGKKAPSDLEFGEYAEEYRKAVAWDKDPLNHELSAAKSFSDPEKYINFTGMKLTDEQKDRRRKVWEHANEQDTFEETAAAPDGVVEDYVPPKTAAPLPKDRWIVGKRYRGADGSTRTYKGDGKWE